MDDKLKFQINKTYNNLYDLHCRFNFLNKEIRLLMENIIDQMQLKGYEMKINNFNKWVFVKTEGLKWTTHK